MQQEVLQIIRGIVAGIIRTVLELTDRLPEAITKPRPNPESWWITLAGRASAALATCDWNSAVGRAVAYRLAMVQPWGVDDLPLSVTFSTDAMCTLARALGGIFDAINLPPFLTHRLCTRWCAAACKVVRLCDAAREMRHPRPHRAAVTRKVRRRLAAAAAPPVDDAPADAAALPAPRRRNRRAPARAAAVQARAAAVAAPRVHPARARRAPQWLLHELGAPAVEGQAEEDSEGEGTEEEGTDGQLESDSDCDGSVF